MSLSSTLIQATDGQTEDSYSSRSENMHTDSGSKCLASAHQWCGLRLSVLWQDRSWTKKIGLADLMLCFETLSCHARRHNDLKAHSNFSSTVYNFSIMCLEHHYCGDQQWRSLT